MAQRSSIEWTDATWNPVTGCSKISPGCKHCYAERMALRLQAMGQPRYRDGFEVTLQPDVVDQPLAWRKPRNIFVNSMSDLFHVESQAYTWRIDRLRRVPAAVRFLSIEPLLGPLPCMNLKGIQWVIVGGESGPHARPIRPAWVREIRDQCLGRNVPFFFKQWGGVWKSRTGRSLDGRTWDELPPRRPVHARLRPPAHELEEGCSIA